MADTFSIKVGGALEYKRELAAVRDQLQPQLLTMAIEAGKVALGAARAATPHETGRSRAGWFLHVIGGSHRGRGFLVVLDHEFNTPGKFPRSDRKLGYSLLDILEYGSRAHVIVPRRDRRVSSRRIRGPRFLRFLIGGRAIFTRRVHHPGTKAYGMTRLAAAVGSRAWQQLATRAVEAAFAKLKGR